MKEAANSGGLRYRCPETDLEVSVRHGVAGASVIATAVPTSAFSCAPCLIVILLAVRISRLSGRTVAALRIMARVGHSALRQRGSYKHSRKDCSRANQSEFRHAYLLFHQMMRMTKRSREQTFRPRTLKDNLVLSLIEALRPLSPWCSASRFMRLRSATDAGTTQTPCRIENQC